MAGRISRNISLSSELDGFIAERLSAGDYGNASEVVRAALRLLRRHDAGAVPAPDWPRGGGECGAMVRGTDWSRTALGPIAQWSPELRTTVSNVVNSPVAKVLMWGADHVMIYNDAYREIAGANHPKAMGGTVPGVFPEIWDWNRQILDAGFRGETLSYRDQVLALNRDGAMRDIVFDLFYTPVYDSDGRVGGVLCTCVDNTARVLAERELVKRETELRTVTDALPVLISFIDRDYVFRFANRHYVEWFGYEPDQIVGRHARDVIGEQNFTIRRDLMDRAIAGETIDSDGTIYSGDGSPKRANVRYLPRVEDGVVTGFLVLVFDLEDRAQREEALAASNSRFRAAMDAIHGVLWTNSADGRMLGEQPGWGALTGQSQAEYEGYGWADAVHPDDAAATIAAWERAVATKSMFLHEHRVKRHCGTWRTFAIRALPILDPRGEITEWVGVHTDITHQRVAEQALRDHADELEREVRHRERAEVQLRELNETLEARVIAEIGERREAEMKLARAQKMEAVGKLTGGVAHDFNNLLQVVSGNLQLLGRDVMGNTRAEQRVTNALAGVSRGAKLAAQLLAFGRRQALEPKVVNISRFVRGMDDMLRRALGEAIEIETVVAAGLWNTFIDPGQVENALLNLAINARDAMEGQGRLTIELGNASLDDDYCRRHADEVKPGQYVMLAVTDTGSGMAPEVLAHVFEPFFTTKGEGKGSGLGLSMVYGFVRQSGGHVNVYSEQGVGTTIRLYLPRAMEAEDVEVMTIDGPVSGGSETVLVVEDDDEVRATVVEMLTDLGYRVLKAVDAASGLAVIESGVPIDLLFTDVVMPGALKSPEMARKARERLPGLAVLFTSGYTENSIVHGGRLDSGVELLSKPYTREALARKIRYVLALGGVRGEGAAVAAPAPAPERLTILLVEDDALIRAGTAEILTDAGHVVVEAGSAEEAMAALQTAPVDVLVTDLNLPGSAGDVLARRARELRPAIGIVFATGDPEALDRGTETGAIVLAKPYGRAALVAVVRRAADAIKVKDAMSEA